MQVKDMVRNAALVSSACFLIYTSQDIRAMEMEKKTQQGIGIPYPAMEITLAGKPETEDGVPASMNDRDMVPVGNETVESQRYILSDAETQMLVTLAMAESEGEGTDGKALVMLTVLNRVESDKFPDSIEEVIFQEISEVKQFSTVEEGGRYWTSIPDQECMDALELIQSGWDESMGSLYFESCDRESWQSRTCEYLFCYGGHRFYR